VRDLAEMKKQMETLTTTMNALLHEKSVRSENEDRRQYQDYREGNSSEGGRPYQHRFNRMDFPKFDGENPANWLYKATQYFDFNQIQGIGLTEPYKLSCFLSGLKDDIRLPV